MSVFRRDQLFLLSIKHLRHFLTTKDIAIEQCTEKYHLVDLIMQFAERNGQKSMTDIAREEMRQMEVEMMRQEELRRQQEEEARRRQQEPQSTSNDAQGSPIIADTVRNIQ